MNESELPTIDPLADDLRLLGDLIQRLPYRPSPQVVSRWVQRGVRGARLRVIKIAGRNMTTECEFRRFVAAMQERPEERTDADLESVDRQLREAGYAA